MHTIEQFETRYNRFNNPRLRKLLKAVDKMLTDKPMYLMSTEERIAMSDKLEQMYMDYLDGKVIE